MKIGILTFHRALNYGAVLQCYALQETLRSEGHKVEVIDYRPNCVERYRKLFNWDEWKNFSIASRIKRLLFAPLYVYNTIRAVSAFDSFIANYLQTSKRVKGIDDIPNNYDAIVFGSDQIWSPQICEGCDPVYWGQFKKGKTIFVTYAPSYGGHNIITDRDKVTIKDHIKVFDALSTREGSLRDCLSGLTDKPVRMVLDPTLLASREVFDKIAVKPHEENYVLLFTVEEVSGAYEFAKQIAEEKGINKVIKLTAIPNVRNMEDDVRSAVTPGEFCGYFKYARYCVVVSFHGTSFSLIFEKDFYTLRSPKEDRARNLLSHVGLESRMVKPDNVKGETAVSYSGVREKLEAMRNDSLSYLNSAIANRHM